jgi:Fe-Mn family superoxide dismutase
MDRNQALYRTEQIGLCKWRDREHAAQMASFITGLEPPFIRLTQEWGMHLAAAETQAREWFYALKEMDLDLPEDAKEYEAFEERMHRQSAEYIRQLELMREHSSVIRHSRTYRAFLAHIIQDARILIVMLRHITRSKPEPVSEILPVRISLRRKSEGGWSLQK